jgi:hypothetical protein
MDSFSTFAAFLTTWTVISPSTSFTRNSILSWLTNFSYYSLKKNEKQKLPVWRKSSKIQWRKNHIIRGKFDTPNTHLHDRSLFWLGAGTSVKGAVLSKMRLTVTRLVSHVEQELLIILEHLSSTRF